jgi:hypothetical protein
MKSILLGVILISVPCLAQKPTASTGNATTKADCSPAVTGSNNNFKFSCGVGKEQGEQIIALLNKMLAKDDTSVVIDKLNELLRRTNPNLRVKTYRCNGEWISTGPGASAMSETYSGGVADVVPLYQEMGKLNNAGQYSELLKKSLAEIESKPEWLTPRLFASLAYLAINDRQSAKTMLAYYDSMTGPAYNEGACVQLSVFLHSKLD